MKRCGILRVEFMLNKTAYSRKHFFILYLKGISRFCNIPFIAYKRIHGPVRQQVIQSWPQVSNISFYQNGIKLLQGCFLQNIFIIYREQIKLTYLFMQIIYCPGSYIFFTETSCVGSVIEPVPVLLKIAPVHLG